MSNERPAATREKTNVRAFNAQRVLPAVFPLVCRVAPDLASTWAEAMFFTPRRHARSAEESAFLRTGREDARVVGGRKIVTWTFGGTSRPTVLLAHGWAGRGGQLRAFVPPLLQAGFSAVVYDAPAHGASEGSRTTLLEFADVMCALGEARGGFHGVIAHSLGAAAAVLAMSRGLRVGRVVLVGAHSDPGAFFRDFLAFLRMPEDLRDHTSRRLERKFAFRWADFDLERHVARLEARALLVHDRADAEVPFRNAARLAAAWPSATLLETSGLGHRRVLRDGAIVARVATFLTGRHAETTRPEISVEAELYEREERRERIFAAGRG
jgi:pimeloyl-ACP methyl ester carboxylesterase